MSIYEAWSKHKGKLSKVLLLCYIDLWLFFGMLYFGDDVDLWDYVNYS